jgi:hypothetical protein
MVRAAFNSKHLAVITNNLYEQNCCQAHIAASITVTGHPSMCMNCGSLDKNLKTWRQ